VCLVWFLEQTAFISMHSVRWLVFVTEMGCVRVFIIQAMLALTGLNVYAGLAERSLSLITSMKSLPRWVWWGVEMLPYLLDAFVCKWTMTFTFEYLLWHDVKMTGGITFRENDFHVLLIGVKRETLSKVYVGQIRP